MGRTSQVAPAARTWAAKASSARRHPIVVRSEMSAISGRGGTEPHYRLAVNEDPRPVLLVTGAVSPYRREPFRLLAEDQGLEVAAFVDAGRRVNGLTVHRTTQAGAARLAASGRYRAVICGLGGRVALPASYAAARLRGIPFVLWATIWSHPRTAVHALSRLPTHHLYRHADAVMTYGTHVSRHVEAVRGTRGNLFVAPQAVDIDHYAAPVGLDARMEARRRVTDGDGPLVLFVGRLEEEKGVRVLLDAWRKAELGDGARLALVGRGPLGPSADDKARGVRDLGYVDALGLPAFYAAADMLVVPSIRTATFTEPWGLVVNEAMLQGTPVIVSDTVGAAAGGLVRDGETGLVFPAGDAQALAARMAVLAGAPELRRQLGDAGAQAASELTPAAWARGAAAALESVGVAR
jgi:glycosyltransferase involved in cell wall biosynthesis